nr:MAG: hypothetical protein D6756_12500 [Cyanobacteria bacterium J083]
MKRLFIGSISALALSLISLPSLAGDVAATSQYSGKIYEVTPFNLVTHGYQGYFKEQGIPSNGAFLTAVRWGKIDEIDLIESAIAKGRLSPETINDEGYRRAVAQQIRDIVLNQ